MILRMGIDIAVRAPHQASLADDRGELLWSGHRFRTTVRDLERLWALLPEGSSPSQITIVMEPTRNAWVPLAAWFRRQGAHVVLVSAERSSDLRAYYAKHTKSDRLDSVLLARLPMLHPEGLHPERGLGPGDPLRRATKLHSTLVKRRTTSLARLDALLEILGPGWHAAFGAHLGNKTPLRFLAAGYADPHTVNRLGRARLARFLYRHSRGAFGDDLADQLLAAATATVDLWAEDLPFPDLAEDIAIEARLALGSPRRSRSSMSASPCWSATETPTASSPPPPASARSPERSSWDASATPTGSAPWPRPVPSAAWSHLWTPPVSPAATAPPPNAETPCSGRPCSSARTKPAASTPPWQRSTTGSSSAPASTTTPRSATSPPHCSPGSSPAGTTTPPTNSATSTADPSTPPKPARSSPSATKSPTTPPSTRNHSDGPAKQGVTTCSINRPVQHPR